MANNRINNNSEVLELTDLEALVRVYLAPEGELMRFTIESMIVRKLADIDQLRGYKFDTKAAAKELLAEINSKA